MGIFCVLNSQQFKEIRLDLTNSFGVKNGQKSADGMSFEVIERGRKWFYFKGEGD